MKTLKKTDEEVYNLLELYVISKNLSDEILFDEFIQARGAYYSTLSDQYGKTKRYLNRKLLLTKLFYTVIFGILPIIPLFAYFEYIRLLMIGTVDFDLIMFAISLLYGFYFLLQFFNFLLMTILETTVIMSGKITEWFKTLPLSNINLKRIVYVTIFKNFDIPIITIIFAFPITMLIGTANILLFFISLGISFIDVFLAFNLIIFISERLNRILNINDVSSKKTFFIRLFNIFSYVFLLLGSVYLIQWASSSLGAYFDLFLMSDYPELINVVLSIIPYPFSQSYLIALTFSPTYTSFTLWISSLIGIGVLVVISYVVYNLALKSLNKVLYSEMEHKQKAAYIEALKIKVKSKSPFKAFLKKDLVSASRDLKVFLSFIMPILLSFIFVIYLNLGNINPSEPIEFQVFRIWIKCLMITPVISSILVFSLLNLESTGQSILESLPLIPRSQAKAKLLIMFIILTLAIILPSLLFLSSPQFLVFLISFAICLPFAWVFLLLSFVLRIYFFGKRSKSYIVADVVIGNSYFKWLIIFLVPLSICVWMISMSTLLSAFTYPFILYVIGFNSLVLIGGLIFIIFLFNKLFPKIKLKPEEIKLEPSFRMIERPTFFTNHIWISIILIIVLNYIFGFLSAFLGIFLMMIIPTPYYWYFYDGNFIQYLLYIIYMLIPICVFSLTTALLYFILVPRVFGIPYGRKKLSRYLTDIGANWLTYIFKYKRYIIFGGFFLISTFLTIYLFNYQINFYFSSDWYFFVYTMILGFWYEIIYRGVYLTMLNRKFRNSTANLLHLIIIFIPSLLNPQSTMFLLPIMEYRNLPQITGYILFVIYNFTLGYIYLKTKNLLPNISLLFVLTLAFWSVGMSPTLLMSYY